MLMWYADSAKPGGPDIPRDPGSPDIPRDPGGPDIHGDPGDPGGPSGSIGPGGPRAPRSPCFLSSSASPGGPCFLTADPGSGLGVSWVIVLLTSQLTGNDYRCYIWTHLPGYQQGNGFDLISYTHRTHLLSSSFLCVKQRSILSYFLCCSIMQPPPKYNAHSSAEIHTIL